MKKLASLLMAGLLAVAMIAPVAADSTKVLNGTPVVDGQLDEIYLQSAVQTLGDPFHWWDFTAGEEDMTAQAYFLWDDEYLYVAVDVDDPEVISVGAAVYEANPQNWQAEATELWFDEGNGKWKTHAEATGLTFFVQGVNGEPTFTSEDCQYAVSLTDDGYITEYAMPVANLKAGGTISTTLQVNDLASCEVHPGTGYASGSQDANIVLTFDAEQVVLPEPETEAEVVEIAEEAAAAPQTFDAGVIAAVAAIVSAAGYAISKKR